MKVTHFLPLYINARATFSHSVYEWKVAEKLFTCFRTHFLNRKICCSLSLFLLFFFCETWGKYFFIHTGRYLLHTRLKIAQKTLSYSWLCLSLSYLLPLGKIYWFSSPTHHPTNVCVFLFPAPLSFNPCVYIFMLHFKLACFNVIFAIEKLRETFLSLALRREAEVIEMTMNKSSRRRYEFFLKAHIYEADNTCGVRRRERYMRRFSIN